MARNPRVSRSLRAFSGVGVQSTLPTENDLRDELIYKRKKRHELQSVTWQEFKKVVDEKCDERHRREVSGTVAQFSGSDRVRDSMNSE